MERGALLPWIPPSQWTELSKTLYETVHPLANRPKLREEWLRDWLFVFFSKFIEEWTEQILVNTKVQYIYPNIQLKSEEIDGKPSLWPKIRFRNLTSISAPTLQCIIYIIHISVCGLPLISKSNYCCSMLWLLSAMNHRGESVLFIIPHHYCSLNRKLQWIPQFLLFHCSETGYNRFIKMT